MMDIMCYLFEHSVDSRDLRGQPAPRGFEGPPRAEFSLSLVGQVRVDITRASAGCAGACGPRAALVRAPAGRS